MFDMTMLDFSRRLKENAHLLSLLSHYALLGSEDRTIWQDRLMQMEGVDPKQLTVLHGELIAFDWIEQNTGHAIGRPDGTLGGCYRVTQNGLREYRRIHGIEVVEEQPEKTEKSPPRIPRKKKEKKEPEVVATSEERSDSMAWHDEAGDDPVIPCDGGIRCRRRYISRDGHLPRVRRAKRSRADVDQAASRWAVEVHAVPDDFRPPQADSDARQADDSPDSHRRSEAQAITAHSACESVAVRNAARPAADFVTPGRRSPRP